MTALTTDPAVQSAVSQTPQGGTPPVQTQQPKPEPIAGKFADEAAFWTGLNEARKMRNLPPLQAVGAGEGKTYAKIDDAVAEYKTLVGAPLTPPGPPITDDMDFAAIFKANNLDPQALGEKFAKDGKLSDADYAAIKKAIPGATKATIDAQYRAELAIAQTKAKEYTQAREQVAARAREIAGGEEQFKTLVGFLKSMPDGAQKKAIVDQIESFDTYEAGMFALRGLYDAKSGGDKARPLTMGGMPTPPAPPSSMTEFLKLKEAERNGDSVAKARLEAMTTEQLIRFTQIGRQH